MRIHFSPSKISLWKIFLTNCWLCQGKKRPAFLSGRGKPNAERRSTQNNYDESNNEGRPTSFNPRRRVRSRSTAPTEISAADHCISFDKSNLQCSSGVTLSDSDQQLLLSCIPLKLTQCFLVGLPTSSKITSVPFNPSKDLHELDRYERTQTTQSLCKKAVHKSKRPTKRSYGVEFCGPEYSKLTTSRVD